MSEAGKNILPEFVFLVRSVENEDEKRTWVWYKERNFEKNIDLLEPVASAESMNWGDIVHLSTALWPRQFFPNNGSKAKTSSARIGTRGAGLVAAAVQCPSCKAVTSKVPIVGMTNASTSLAWVYRYFSCRYEKYLSTGTWFSRTGVPQMSISIHEKRANFTGLLLGCIEADFCNQIFFGKLSPRSTQCTMLHSSPVSFFQLLDFEVYSTFKPF